MTALSQNWPALFTSTVPRGRTLEPMDNAAHVRDDELPDAINELTVALHHPNAFRQLVDLLEPSPVVTALRLWGAAHGVYPADPLPVSDFRELVEFANRLGSEG